MSVNTESIIHNILERVSGIGYVKPEDIPNIDLYMDQNIVDDRFCIY